MMPIGIIRVQGVNVLLQMQSFVVRILLISILNVAITTILCSPRNIQQWQLPVLLKNWSLNRYIIDYFQL